MALRISKKVSLRNLLHIKYIDACGIGLAIFALIVQPLVSGSGVSAVDPIVSGDNSVCAADCEYTTVADAVAGEADGSTITIKSGTYTITSTILVNKKLTLVGEPGAILSTNGSNHVFVTTANGVVIRGLEFKKTDKTSQNMINVQGKDTTISDNVFSGQYVMGDGEVARALEISTTTGLNIDGNRFTALRQPAYINDNTTGIITNNFVGGTRGWVVLSNTDLTFSGNTWGTNATDIAIIAGVAPNNYSCERVVQIRALNNNAKVDPQALSVACAAQPNETRVVKQSLLNGWNFYQEEPGNTDVTGGSFVRGPGVVPAGVGSLRFELKSATDRLAFIKYNSEFAGTKLKDVAQIDYSTYTDAASGTTVQATALQFEIDKDSTNSSSDYSRIVYEPYHANEVRKGEWQRWTTLDDAAWWLSRPNGTACEQSSPCTWAQLRAAYPNAAMQSYAGPILRGGAWDGNYKGNVDKLTIATTTQNITYDFEDFDTTPPVLTTATPSEGQIISTRTTGQKLTISGTFTDNVGPNYAHIQLVDVPGNSRGLTTVYGNTAGTYSTQLPTTGLADGVYRLYVWGTDAVGNVSDRNANIRRFTLDNTRPTISLQTPVVDALNPTEIVATASDNVSLQTVTLNIYNQQNTILIKSCSKTVSGLNAQVTCPVPNDLGDGVYTIRYNAKDTAGNISSTETRIFAVDHTAPAAPTVLQWQDSTDTVTTATNDPNGTAVWNASASSDVSYYIYHYWNDIAGNPYKQMTPYSTTVNGLSLPGVFNQGQGVHHYCVIAVDTAGNQSACSQPATITYGIVETTLSGDGGQVQGTTDSRGGSNGSTNTTASGSGSGGSTQSLQPASSYRSTYSSYVAAADASEAETSDTSAIEAQAESRSVLGATSYAGDGDVLAATDEATANGCQTILGVCWYYWIIPIVVAIIGAIWWLAASRRRQKDDEIRRERIATL